MTNKSYKYDVASVLINYNTSHHTMACIQSLLQNTSRLLKHQIIVVDNCSEMEDYFRLKAFCEHLHCEHLHLVRSNLNLGFGAGNMYGTQFVDAEYIAFVNNDTLMQQDYLSVLIETLREHPEVGIVGGQPYGADGGFQRAFRHFPTPGKKLLGRGFYEKLFPERYPKCNREYTHPMYVDWVLGSLMVVRAEDFYEVGGFDLNLFFYNEEPDLCWRMLQIGKRTMFVPSAKYIHNSGSSSSASAKFLREITIGEMYLMRKQHGYCKYLLVRSVLMLKYSVRAPFNKRCRIIWQTLLRGASLADSLRHQQKVRNI